MSIASKLALKGRLEIQTRRRGGELVDERVINNRIVDYGLDLLSRYLVSAHINDTEFATGKETRPVRAIAVGTTTNNTPFDAKATRLEAEVQRVPIDGAELIRATATLTGGSPAADLLKITSKIKGAYGNRLQAEVITPTPPNVYAVRIKDSNDPYRDPATGSYQPNSAPPVMRAYESESLAQLATLISNDIAVDAFAPDPNATGLLTPGPIDLTGGGAGVVVSATFSTTTTLALTEAGLFTSSNANEPLMFNAVKFPVINLTSDLDITFRWKISFEESAA